MYYELGMAIAGGIAAAGVLVLIVRGWGDREPVPHGLQRVYVLIGLALLAAGAAVFVGTYVSPNEDLDPGIGALGVAPYLLVVGLLGLIHPKRASKVLMWSAAAAVPVMGVLTIVTFFFDKATWRFSSAAPLLMTVMAFSIPSVVCGAMFLAAGEAPAPRGSGERMVSA